MGYKAKKKEMLQQWNNLKGRIIDIFVGKLIFAHPDASSILYMKNGSYWTLKSSDFKCV